MKDKKLWLNIATKLFLLPLIEEENSLKWLNKTTLGIYVADTNKPEWENKIIICYDRGAFPNELKVRFKKNKNSYAEYTELINGNAYKVIAFTIPPQLKKDFTHLLNGEYTKVSIQTQNKILDHWGPISSKARKIATHFFNGYNYSYSVKPKLNEAILNLNNIPIKKADFNPPLSFLQPQRISTNLTQNYITNHL